MYKMLPLFAFLSLGCPQKDLVVDDTDTDTNTDTDPLEITGTYTDNFLTHHLITESEWTMGADSVFHILNYSNTEAHVVAMNDPSNPFNPGLYSRMDWAWVDATELWFCQTAFSAASLADAENTPEADSSDLTGGCGGFGWSQLQ